MNKANQRHSLAANSAELAELAISSAVGSGTDSAKLATKTDTNARASNPQQKPPSALRSEPKQEDENIYAEDDCDDDDEEEETVDERRRSGGPRRVESGKKEDIYEDEDEDLDIPRGWHVGLSKCKRKFFYNDFNKDRVSSWFKSLWIILAVSFGLTSVYAFSHPILVVFELRYGWQVLLLQRRRPISVDTSASLSN